MMELRLIVEASTHIKSSNSITLGGRQWVLSEPLDISDEASIPNFICISYSWGSGRCPNPFHRGMDMSDQTLPALAAVIHHAPLSTFWIDTFCIPSEQPQRSSTLQSMGFIYNLASEVFVSLSGPMFAVLDHMNRSDILDEKHIWALERDVWVSSFWTYQEVMNSRRFKFVSHQQGDAVVDGTLFLNRLGYSLNNYRKLKGLSAFSMRDQLPYLDSFESLIGDWQTLGFAEVTALQVISNIDRRLTTEPKNIFFSMFGVLTKNPAYHKEDSTLAELSESFMEICEQKNDYSFIYSSTPRDERVGKKWRPRPDVLHAILVWQTRENSNQRGYHNLEGFWLENVIEPPLWEQLDSKIKVDMLQRLEISDQKIDSNVRITQRIYHKLQRMGFTGSNTCIESRHGFFFPQTPLNEKKNLKILVATTVTWAFGAPGIARFTSENTEVFIPGVFVGSINNDVVAAVLLDSSVE